MMAETIILTSHPHLVFPQFYSLSVKQSLTVNPFIEIFEIRLKKSNEIDV